VNEGFFRRLRAWSVPLGVAAVCLAFGFGGEAARAWAQYDRAGLETGELWRLLTAHVVHLGWSHLWLNVLALALICLLFEDVLSAHEWLATTFVAALAIDLGLYVWNNDVLWYVGLSGVLHGYVAVGAVRLAAERSALGAALVLGVAAKIAWEQAAGPVPFTQSASGGPVVVAAHLYGALGGLAVATATAMLRRHGRHRHAL
jgi:rhomboid family GlyGly-CTERM serine protease